MKKGTLAAWVFLLSSLLPAVSFRCAAGPLDDSGFFKEVSVDASSIRGFDGIESVDFKTLHFREINNEFPAMTLGQKHGLVYRSEPLKCEHRISLFFKNSQFLKQFELELQLVNNASQRKQLIVRSTPIINDWTAVQWEIPVSWRGQEVQLLITHTGPYHPLSEFAFSDPFEAELHRTNTSLSTILVTLFKCLAYAALLGFPALVIWVRIVYQLDFRLGKLSEFPMVFMILTSLSALVFGCAVFTATGSMILVLILNTWSLLSLEHPRLRKGIAQTLWRNLDFRNSLHLLFLSTAIALFAGLIFGGWHDIGTTSQLRYLESSLPDDNSIPGILVERLFNDLPISPFFDMWLSSDRPPMQSAILLLVRGFLLDPENDGQLLSILLQSSAIPFFYLLFRGIRVDRELSFVLSLSLVFSSSFLLNSFFVWPKLLAVSYLLFTTVLLLYPQTFLEGERPHIRAILLGLGSAFALLTHGGSLFGLIPLFFTAILFWRLPHPRYWLSMIIPFFIFMIPWILYQKLIDPPGDQLLRWHIAGLSGESDQGFLALLLSQYQALGWQSWTYNKIENIRMLWGNWSVAFVHLFPFQVSNHFHLLRTGLFQSFFQSLLFQFPFILVFPLAILSIRRRNTAWKHLPLLIISVIGLAIWVLLMFKPGRTTLHQGTYYLPFIFISYFVLTSSDWGLRYCLFFIISQMVFASIVWVLPSLPGQLSNEWIINPVSIDPLSFAGYLLLLMYSMFLVIRCTRNITND